MVRAHAGLITFGTRAAFNVAAGALPMETFESGTSAPNTFVPCPSPESSASNNACFGLDVLLFTGGSIDVNVFDSSNALIQTFLRHQQCGIFFGVISDSGLIGHINLVTSVTPNSNYEGVDNVAFGLTAASAPEPSTLGMLGLGAAALALLGRRTLPR